MLFVAGFFASILTISEKSPHIYLHTQRITAAHMQEKKK